MTLGKPIKWENEACKTATLQLWQKPVPWSATGKWPYDNASPEKECQAYGLHVQPHRNPDLKAHTQNVKKKNLSRPHPGRKEPALPNINLTTSYSVHLPIHSTNIYRTLLPREEGVQNWTKDVIPAYTRMRTVVCWNMARRGLGTFSSWCPQDLDDHRLLIRFELQWQSKPTISKMYIKKAPQEPPFQVNKLALGPTSITTRTVLLLIYIF